MTFVDIVPGMRWRRREVSEEERQQWLEDYRVEVLELQRVAYRNFRWAVAGACVFLGLLGGFSVFDSRADLAANILMLVGGLLGMATFFVKNWRLLALAFAVAVGGLVWVLL